MNLFTSINNFFVEKTGFWIQKYHPKPAIKFASKYFKNVKISCIEIGVFRGRNSIEMKKHLNIKKFYLIDPYLKYDGYLNDSISSHIETSNAEKLAKNRLKKNKNAIWIKKMSSDAINEIKEKVDFLYIDGNHNYKYIKDDLEKYYELVKDGGIVSGHDIDWAGVSKAVVEFVNKRNVTLHISGCDWWFIK